MSEKHNGALIAVVMVDILLVLSAVTIVAVNTNTTQSTNVWVTICPHSTTEQPKGQVVLSDNLVGCTFGWLYDVQQSQLWTSPETSVTRCSSEVEIYNGPHNVTIIKPTCTTEESTTAVCSTNPFTAIGASACVYNLGNSSVFPGGQVWISLPNNGRNGIYPTYALGAQRVICSNVSVWWYVAYGCYGQTFGGQGWMGD
jgi:hypothetical protein